MAAIMHLWNNNISQLCKCYFSLVVETIEHLLLKGEVAGQIWRYFTRAAGIIGPLIQLKQTVNKWWTEE
ncbi:hypothetical protein HAX54_027290, partial [Datura stramonium]|nr:hypothetical protein [Datura stramonium]